MFGEAQILEPDVTLTDYLLAVQCLCFAVLLYRKRAPVQWLFFFASLGIASWAGGTVHGFLPDESSVAYGILWRMSLIAIGGATLAGWHAGAKFLQNERTANLLKAAAILQFAGAAAVILFYSQAFVIAALNYLPAAVFLLIVFVSEYLRTKQQAFLWGAAGMVLTFAGAFVQIAKVSLHAEYFNHNALYHAIQLIALCFLFVSASHIPERPHAR